MEGTSFSAVRKSQPTLSDVHVSTPLSNVSLASWQDPAGFVYPQVFPEIPVVNETGKYFEFEKGNLYRLIAAKRAPGARSAGGGFTINSTGNYICDEWSVHSDLPIRTLRNADAPLNLKMAKARWCTDQIRLALENDFLTSFFAASKWTTDWTGGSAASTTVVKYWDNDGSDPVADALRMRTAIYKLTGRFPNRVVAGHYVDNKLRTNAAIADRLKYGGNDGKALTPQVTGEKLAELFQVEKYLVSQALYNSAAQGQTDSMDFLGGSHFMMCYAPNGPAIDEPSAGYTFRCTTSSAPGAANGIATKEWEDLDHNVVRFESTVLVDQKLVMAAAGGIITSVLENPTL